MRIVVKIGGAALDSAGTLQKCARALAQLAEGHQVAVVHGGGAALPRMLAQLGNHGDGNNGWHGSDSEVRDVALMVLAGRVNKELVAALGAAGQPAVGMCGGDGLAFRARKKSVNGEASYVGEISSVDPRWMEAIWNCGGVPVISSLALGTDGQYYNIDADEMASACAVACQANALIFLTDVPGVKDADGAVIRWLDIRQIPDLAEHAVVSGGMLPKLEACRQALRRGVGRVRILPLAEAEVLPQLYFARIESGTEVTVQ